MTEAQPVLCGHCGAPVSFSGDLPFLYCPYCRHELQHPSTVDAALVRRILSERAEAARRTRVERLLEHDVNDEEEWKSTATCLLQGGPTVSKRWLASMRKKWLGAEAALMSPNSGSQAAPLSAKARCEFVRLTRSLALGLLDRLDITKAAMVIERGARALGRDTMFGPILQCDLAFCEMLQGNLARADQILAEHDAAGENGVVGSCYRLSRAWVALAHDQPKEALVWLKTGDTETPLWSNDSHLATFTRILRATAFERLGSSELALAELQVDWVAAHRWTVWLRRLAPRLRLCESSVGVLARKALPRSVFRIAFIGFIVSIHAAILIGIVYGIFVEE